MLNPDFLIRRVASNTRLPHLLAWLTVVVLLSACDTPPAPHPEQVTPMAATSSAKQIPVAVATPLVDPADAAARHTLSYHAALLQLNAGDLAREQGKHGDGRASAQQAVDLALVLGLTRAPGDLQRAQNLLKQVLANPHTEAQAWREPAQLLLSRYTDQRQLEEQVERLNQQLRDTQRDHQRKLDQLNDKLEALKSIERSLTSRPAHPAVPVKP